MTDPTSTSGFYCFSVALGNDTVEVVFKEAAPTGGVVTVDNRTSYTYELQSFIYSPKKGHFSVKCPFKYSFQSDLQSSSERSTILPSRRDLSAAKTVAWFLTEMEMLLSSSADTSSVRSSWNDVIIPLSPPP